MNNKVIIGIAVAIVIAIGGYLFPSVQGTVIEKFVGNSSGPDRTDSCESTAGVQKCWERRKLTVASTTPCAIKSPSATSTLSRASLQVQTSTSTATVWTVAKATTGFATTTAFDQFSLGSGALGSMYVGSASSTAPDEASVFGPNEYVVWGVQGTAISDVTKLNGVCAAEFTVF